MIPSLVLALSTFAASPAPGDVLARAGSLTITRELLDAYWAALPSARRQGYEEKGGRRAFLDDLIDTKLAVAEAERAGIAARPELRAQAEMARDTLLYRALFDEEVTRKILTEDVLRAWYESNKERFRVEEMVRARQIVVTPFPDKRKHNEAGDDAVNATDAEAKARRLLAELKGGADFAALAKRYSEDPSAAEGGLLADFPRGRMAKPVEDAAFALGAGKLSDVVRSPYGFHLLKVEAVLPAHIPPFDEIRDTVTRHVAEERKDSFGPRWEAVRARLRSAVRIEIDEAALPPAPRPSPTPSGAAPAPAPPPGRPGTEPR